MAEVSDLFFARWRSGDHVANKRPRQYVEFRNGYFDRTYGEHEMLDGSHPRVGYFPTTTRALPWHAYYIPTSDWAEIPNVLEVGFEQDFENNGVTRATLQVENIAQVERDAQDVPELDIFDGIYHVIERGYLAPWRGFSNERGGAPPRNAWYDQLAENAQVRIWQGYGTDVWVPVWTGLLDDLELEATPDRIQLSARDFGQLYIDQRFMGYAKDKLVKDPVTFADRRYADDTFAAGAGASASSNRIGSHARFVLDKDPNTKWISRGHDVPENTEWVQIRLPRGRYEDFYVWPGAGNMRCYVSVYARPGRHGPAKCDGVALDEGWIDLGNGDVPGDEGGVPIVREIASLKKNGGRIRLRHILELGDDSVMRLSFRNLQRGQAGQHFASVRRFVAVRRRRKKDAIKARWILVDDAADVVKIVLRWCGFQEWEVENCGVSLTDKLVFNRSDFLVDAVKKISELTGFVFFMGDPSSHPDSRGVPVFRQSSAFRDPGNIMTIRDKDLLTGVKVKITDEPLVTVIRVRGKLATKEQGGRRDFVGSGADTVRAYQAFYRPPWARAQGRRRLAGIIKHVVNVDPFLSSRTECHKNARLIAAAEALKAVTATCQIPAYPGIQLDDQVYLLDEATGMATRLWITNRTSTFRAGKETKWEMSLAGALLDTPDLAQIRDELEIIYAAGNDVDEPLLTGHGEGVNE